MELRVGALAGLRLDRSISGCGSTVFGKSTSASQAGVDADLVECSHWDVSKPRRGRAILDGVPRLPPFRRVLHSSGGGWATCPCACDARGRPLGLALFKSSGRIPQWRW